MLIEFAVRNFRSIRDEQRFSMVATSLSEHRETNTFEANAPSVGRLLRAAVIYGANAAGKSNLLRALDVMQDIVLFSANERQSGEPVPVVPFLLDESSKLPTMFEVVFVEGGVKYQYGFEATRERVISEWLYSFPERQPRKLFSRELDPDTEKYRWSYPSLKGPKSVWRSSTRSNALFLSTANQLNSEQIAPVFNWFRNTLKSGRGTRVSTLTTADAIQNADMKRRVTEFMQRADIGISGFRVVEEPPNEKVVAILRAVVSDASEVEKMTSRTMLQVSVEHRSATGESVWFPLEDESEGTQSLFAFIGPILEVLEKGHIFVVDEINNSLHPLLMRALISSFCDPDVNKSSAQLIFTTHATSILNADLFRRDQIWFAEKDSLGATTLFPLTDFSPRKQTSFAKAYLEGRYGAVPIIGPELLKDG